MHFEPESTPSESVIMSHSAAGYVCGYSFYYQLFGDAELLLRTYPSEELVWFSGRQNHDSSSWIRVNTEQRVFLSSSINEELQFVIVSYSRSGNSIAPQVALDLVELEFCLPCDFDLMATTEGKLPVCCDTCTANINIKTPLCLISGSLRLSYVNHTKIFLRTVHSIPVAVSSTIP